jgi:hypothetical protein
MRVLGMATLAAMSIVVMLLLLPADAVSAETTELDAKVMRLAVAHPTWGLVFAEARLFEDGAKTPRICQSIELSVASANGFSDYLITQVSPTLFGHASESSTYGGWAVLPPGTYTAVSVKCKGAGGYNFRGQFAQFRVQSAEISNLGSLLIDFKLGPFLSGKFIGRTAVEGLSPKATESLAKLAPVAFSKATKRYMTPNPATSAPKPAQ